MSMIKCPAKGCTNRISCDDDYDGTIQCDNCATVVRVITRKGKVVDAKIRKLDFEIPSNVSSDLRNVLCQAVACFEAGSPAATVVLCGLFMEGLLIESGLSGKRLIDMIEAAHKAGNISALGYHMATASRMIRNIGAHYSDELAKLSESDARLVLEMTRKLTTDILSSKNT
jgi:hypothetical protein